VVAAPQSSPVVAAPQSSPVVAAPQLSPIIEESSTTPVIEPSSPIVAASQPSPIIEESSTTPPIVAEPSLPSPVIKESAIPPQKPILVEELPTPLPIGARYEAFFESLENAGVKRKRLEDDDFDDIRREKRNRILALLSMITNAPQSYKEAMSTSDKAKWLEAMQQEVNSLTALGTYEEVDPKSIDKSVLPGRWVYNVKSDGRFKARFVARGDKQVYGEDFNETYAAVSSLSSLRTLLAISAIRGWTLAQFDVETAFLHGDIDCDVYVTPPQGFRNGNIWKLKKSLYGLCQSPRLWREKWTSTLTALGWQPLQSENSIWKNGETFMLFYVDDCLMAPPNQKEVDSLSSAIKQHFSLVSIGKPTTFLGIDVACDPTSQSISLSMESYITKKAKVFGWENLHPVKTPLPTDAALKTISESPLLDDAGKQKYQQLVGCLLWASVTTRPDIAYAVQFLARSMANPTEVVFSTAKHCMRYLYTTRSLAITYQSDTNNQQLSMYTDAAFADCLSTRRSTSAYIAVLVGAPISWRSSRQHIDTLHSTEAEYLALVDAGKELLWLNRLTNEISPNPGVPTLLCDNIAAITIANGVDKGRTRYIDNYYHWTRMHVARKDFVLDHISGTDQLADGLTKPFSSIQHQRFLQCLGFVFRPRVPRSLEQNTSHAGGVSGKTCLTTIVEEVCG
jgi:hypothetical protein